VSVLINLCILATYVKYLGGLIHEVFQREHFNGRNAKP
jgi:hypothetical protein